MNTYRFFLITVFVFTCVIGSEAPVAVAEEQWHSVKQKMTF
jgi:hypothetical protein